MNIRSIALVLSLALLAPASLVFAEEAQNPASAPDASNSSPSSTAPAASGSASQSATNGATAQPQAAKKAVAIRSKAAAQPLKAKKARTSTLHGRIVSLQPLKRGYQTLVVLAGKTKFTFTMPKTMVLGMAKSAPLKVGQSVTLKYQGQGRGKKLLSIAAT